MAVSRALEYGVECGFHGPTTHSFYFFFGTRGDQTRHTLRVEEDIFCHEPELRVLTLHSVVEDGVTALLASVLAVCHTWAALRPALIRAFLEREGRRALLEDRELPYARRLLRNVAGLDQSGLRRLTSARLTPTATCRGLCVRMHVWLYPKAPSQASPRPGVLVGLHCESGEADVLVDASTPPARVDVGRVWPQLATIGQCCSVLGGLRGRLDNVVFCLGVHNRTWDYVVSVPAGHATQALRVHSLAGLPRLSSVDFPMPESLDAALRATRA